MGIMIMQGGINYLSLAERVSNEIVLIVHPNAVEKRFAANPLKIRSDGNLCQKKLNINFNVQLTQSSVWIAERLVFLGEIGGCRFPHGIISSKSGMKLDYINDDSGLACVAEKGSVIITGCNHTGLKKYIEKAIEITGESTIYAIVGGLHLSGFSTHKSFSELKLANEYNIQHFHTCHCTGTFTEKLFKAKRFSVGDELIPL